MDEQSWQFWVEAGATVLCCAFTAWMVVVHAPLLALTGIVLTANWLVQVWADFES